MLLILKSEYFYCDYITEQLNQGFAFGVKHGNEEKRK